MQQAPRSAYVHFAIDMINSVILSLLALAALMFPGASSLAQPRAGAATVTVLVATNIRVTPALAGEIVGRAAVDTVYVVLEATPACNWLRIAALDDPQQVPLGWITGHPAYVATSVSCAELEATPMPVMLPTVTPDAVTPAQQLTVIVQIDGVAIRSGPSVTRPILRTAVAGERLQVDGQIDACKWLHIHDDAAPDGWISGNFAYSQLLGECADLPGLDPPTPTPIPVPHVSVVLADVNIRAEASTRASVLRTAARDETFVVTGQTGDCAWLRILLDGGAVGWISGNPAYTTLDQPCAALTSVAATPTPQSTAATATRRQGCATVTNYLGFTVRIDIVRSSDRFFMPLFVNGGENYDIPLRMP